MSKRRYIDRSDEAKWAELKLNVNRALLEGKSKRWITSAAGYDIPWSVLYELLAQTRSKRMPSSNGVVGRADEVNMKRVRAMLKFMRSLHFTDQSDGAIVKQLEPNVFQRQAIERWYGPLRDDGSGRRYVNLGALSVPKRNGKTLLCSGIALAHLAGPEAVTDSIIAVVAENMSQAKIVYDYIRDIARHTPDLGEYSKDNRLGRLKFTGGNRPKVACLDTGVTLHVIPGTYKALSGMTINMFILDEYSLHKEEDALYALRQSQGSLDEPFGMVISTKSTLPDNPMAKLIDRWKHVQDGTADANGFDMILLGIEDGEDWRDPKVWYRVNPGLPHSPKIELFHQLVAEAETSSLAERNFKVYNLNADMSSADALFKYELWEECAVPGLSIDDLRGKECYGGLDLSSSRDMTAFALYFPDIGAIFTWAWFPANVIDDFAAQHGVPYRKWVDAGDLLTAGGDTIGYPDLIDAISKICADHNVRGIGYDRWSYNDFEAAVAMSRKQMPPFTEFLQRFPTYGPAVNRFEELLFSRQLKHPNNPVLNTAVKYTGYEVGTMADGARRPTKMATTAKIDACVAAIMAVGTASRYVVSVPNVWGLDAELAGVEGDLEWA